MSRTVLCMYDLLSSGHEISCALTGCILILHTRRLDVPGVKPITSCCVFCPCTQDLEKESDTPLLQVSIEEILEEQRVEQQNKQEAEKVKVVALKERGLSIPRADTLDEY